jgi:hypothetical protein
MMVEAISKISRPAAGSEPFPVDISGLIKVNTTNKKLLATTVAVRSNTA